MEVVKVGGQRENTEADCRKHERCTFLTFLLFLSLLCIFTFPLLQPCHLPI